MMAEKQGLIVKAKYGVFTIISDDIIYECKKRGSLSKDKKNLLVGDIVNFTGSKHYISSGAKAGGACRPGRAKVTQIYGLGSVAHPYHLVAIAGGGATVHGWVDADTVQKA